MPQRSRTRTCDVLCEYHDPLAVTQMIEALENPRTRSLAIQTLVGELSCRERGAEPTRTAEE